MRFPVVGVVLGTVLVALAACGGGGGDGSGGDGPGPDPLVGTWTVDGGSVATARADATPYLVLRGGGAAEGFDGCNGGSGAWARTGDRVDLRDWAATLMACLGPARLADFSGAAPLRLDGETLVVPATDGGEPFRLTRSA